MECQNWNDQEHGCDRQSAQASIWRVSALARGGKAWRLRFHFCSFMAKSVAILFSHMYVTASLKESFEITQSIGQHPNSYNSRFVTTLLLS